MLSTSAAARAARLLAKVFALEVEGVCQTSVGLAEPLSAGLYACNETLSPGFSLRTCVAGGSGESVAEIKDDCPDTGKGRSFPDPAGIAVASAATSGVAAAPGAAVPQPGSVPGTGMCSYNAHTMLDSLNLNDTPGGYVPPIGPSAYVRLTYNQRDASQPATFGFFNVGPKWTVNFLSYVQDNPAVAGSGVMRYVAGGGSVSYPTNGGPYSATTGTFAPEAQTQAVLVRIPASGALTSYELRLPDGGKQVFGLLDGATIAPRRAFLTQIVDPAGNTLTLNYDAQLRLTSLTDATGRTTAFAYELTDSPLLITRITDPFGRSAVLAYLANGQLGSITDVLGMTSSFTYDDAGLINSMTTPYGTTSFSYGQNTQVNSRFLEIVDPLGLAERLEFVHLAPGIAGSDPVAPPGLSNIFLYYRNSFYWDKHALPIARPMAGGAIDYTKAQISHWLHTAASQTSPTIESTKNPLENRVWRTYPKQSFTYFEGTIDLASTVSRVLDDGTTSQLATATYNDIGKPLSTTDPRGRETDYTYDTNNIDLLTVQQKLAAGQSTAPAPLATLASFTYNAQHLPTTFTDASGQTTKYAYNASGQLLSVTDPLMHVTSYAYDNLGRLITITDPNGAVVLTVTYDAFDRVATRTDAAGYVVHYDYDALDRLTRASYPDGTFEQYTYDKLDLVSLTDRRGKITSFTYDANRRLVSTNDPLGHVVKLGYYENRTLKSLTDANGNTTTWDIDLQSRPIAKHFANGATQTVTYEATTSRVARVTDALGQSTVYGYDADNRITSIHYDKALQPTPDVKFEYDPVFPRMMSMTDGIGHTAFAYNEISSPPALGANQLRSVDSPVAGSPAGTDTMAFSYDELGRITGKTIDGAVQTVAYDAVGRVSGLVDPLDSFNYGYADATSRVAAISSTHGPKAAFSYFGPSNDELVQQISFTSSDGAPLAQYGYTYDAARNMLTAAQEETTGKPAAPAPASGTVKAGATGSSGSGPLLAAFALAVLAVVAAALRMRRMRPARRCFAARVAIAGYFMSCGGAVNNPAQIASYAYDDADRLISAQVGDKTSGTRFAYAYDPASNITSASEGTSAKITAYTATNAIVGAAYDSNGSPLAVDGAIYTWDAADRLISVSKSGTESEFSYDGLGRMVRIVEKSAGKTTADHAYTWCGTARCLEHDNIQSGSPVTKQYFDHGVIAGPGSLYYVTDVLGSVRQLRDSAGALRAQYSYDPYGAANKLAGDLDSDLGYAGYFNHLASGLDFARIRAYDAAHQRWLNRDPALEGQGPNLYSYVEGNPLKYIDPTGLWTFQIGGAFTIHFNIFNWVKLNVTFGGGFAIDGNGNFGSYFYDGGGAGAGNGLGGGLNVMASNADTICDLSGPFWVGSVDARNGFGLVGPEVSVDGFTGTESACRSTPGCNGRSQEGKRIIGLGSTIGAGGGVDGYLGMTNTEIQVLHNF